MTNLLKKSLFGITILLTAIFVFNSVSQKETRPKHIIFITVDTTRADHLGIYGNNKIKTPNLDTLAKDSVVFKNCYSTTHTTIPSHTSMFTSLYLKDHGVINMGQALPDFKDFLPKMFQKAAYKTAAFTSGGHLNPIININQGFDEFFYPEQTEITAEENTDKIINWLDKNKDDSFFIWTHFFDPHMEYIPPPPFSKMYNSTSSDTFDNIEATQRERFAKAGYIKHSSNDPEYYRNLYKGEISYMDEQIGRFLDKLKELKIYDDSVIVLVADHGEFMGEHGLFFKHGGGIYDEVTHVPLFIKMGGMKKTGFRNQLVSTVDIYPTLMDLLTEKIVNPIRGKSLTTIIDNAATLEIRSKIYFESVWRITVGERTPDYTYIRDLYELKGTEMINGFRTPKAVAFIEDPKGRQQLFDNYNDRTQEKNIVDTKLELAASFEKDILEFNKDIITVSKGALNVTDKNQLNKLKELGYMK